MGAHQRLTESLKVGLGLAIYCRLDWVALHVSKIDILIFASIGNEKCN